MKRFLLLRISAVIITVIGLFGCGPSVGQVRQAIAETETAVSIPIQAPYPTSTPYPTQTPYFVETTTVSSGYRPITWAEFLDFILEDHTNLHVFSEEYNCVNFSLDLVTSAQSKNIESWIVAVNFEDQVIGHAFVAFPTTNAGVIWIEPQSDDAYTVSKVGQLLCKANNPDLCWPGGALSRITQPATCLPTTHQCW